MKNSNSFFSCFFSKKLVKLLLMIILILPGNLAKSQSSFAIYPSFSIGLGFFYPSDVNDYITNEMMSSYTETYNTDIYLNFELRGGLSFRMKKLEISGSFECAFAPKVVVGADSYSFNRFSPLVSAIYYIPVGSSGKNALLVGGGIHYNFLKFEDFKGSNPGLKLMVGYSMQAGHFNLQPNLSVNIIKAEGSSDYDNGFGYTTNYLDLNYTGVNIGVILSFHRKISYR
jgi:hypothetical protein